MNVYGDGNLADEWVQFVDDETGLPYLHNPVTKESRWIETFTETQDEWETCYDDDGNQFYHNKVRFCTFLRWSAVL